MKTTILLCTLLCGIILMACATPAISSSDNVVIELSPKYFYSIYNLLVPEKLLE